MRLFVICTAVAFITMYLYTGTYPVLIFIDPNGHAYTYAAAPFLHGKI